MTDRDFRAYLLGQLPADDAVRLEERVLGDHEVFEAMKAVEDDLFDDYARGRLAPAERGQFLERFGAQKERLAFAQALAKKTAPAAPRGTVLPFPASTRRFWIPLTAAATVAFAVASWRAQAPSSTLPPATQNGAAASVTASVPVALITLGTSRAASNEQAVEVPANAAQVELRVRIDPADVYDRYAMELRSPADAVVWQSGDLQPAVNAPGNSDKTRVISGQVPTNAIPPGQYELAVRGRRGAANEDLGFVTVKVTPK